MRIDIKSRLDPKDRKHFKDINWLDCCLKCEFNGIEKPAEYCFKGKFYKSCPGWQRETEATYGRIKGRELHGEVSCNNTTKEDIDLYERKTFALHLKERITRRGTVKNIPKKYREQEVDPDNEF